MSTDHFQHILNNRGCDVDSTFSEWTELNLHVKIPFSHPLSLAENPPGGYRKE